MQTYIGTKMIRAKAMTRGDYNKLRGWSIPADENPNDEGFLVEYLDGGKANHKDYDGYISWSPKDVFERAYRPVTGMTFGQAIEAMRGGFKVARSGWNGKGMYIWLMPGSVVHRRGDITDPHLKEINDASGNDTITFGPSARMRAADGSVVTGWLASQTDMFAEDWGVVE